MTEVNDKKKQNFVIVKSIDKAFRILDYLARRKESTIKDISESIILPKGTTHRLISSLIYCGIVRQNFENKTYSLGIKIVELSNLYLQQIDIREEAEPFLRELSKRVKEVVHLVILDGNEAVYIGKVDPDINSIGAKMVSRIGFRNPLHSTAVGKVFLAFMDEDKKIEMLNAKKLEKKTKNTITNIEKLVTHLKRIKKEGYAIDDEENERGVKCVAAPVLNENGKIVAAVSISGISFQMTNERIDRSLKKEIVVTARLISEKFAYKSDS